MEVMSNNVPVAFIIPFSTVTQPLYCSCVAPTFGDHEIIFAVNNKMFKCSSRISSDFPAISIGNASFRDIFLFDILLKFSLIDFEQDSIHLILCTILRKPIVAEEPAQHCSFLA